MLVLLVSALFWELGERDDHESILLRAAVLFYCVDFFIFMRVAVLPFMVIVHSIFDKELLNDDCQPIVYQMMQGLAPISGTGLLAFLASSIIIKAMLKFNYPFWCLLNMALVARWFVSPCCSKAS